MSEQIDAVCAALLDLAHELDPVSQSIVGALTLPDPDADPEAAVAEACRYLAALDAAKQAIQQLRAEVAAEVARILGKRDYTVEGVGTFRPRWSKSRSVWENDRLADDLRPRLLFDMETGEARDGQALLAAVERVITFRGSSMKVTGLKMLGMEPDEYCRAEFVAPTVEVIQ